MLIAYISVVAPLLGLFYLIISLDQCDWNIDDPRAERAFGNMCLYFSAGFLLCAPYVGFGTSELDWRWIPASLFGTVVLAVTGLAFRAWSLDSVEPGVVHTDTEE
jgi:hypothetical protein